MNNVIEALQDKDDKKAYALFKEIGARSAASDEYYSYFDDFLGLFTAKSAKLRILELTSTSIDDISALAGLENLEQLLIGGTSVSDISVLVNFKKLIRVELKGTNIDLTPGSAAMQVIEELKARGASVSYDH